MNMNLMTVLLIQIIMCLFAILMVGT